MAMYDYVVPDVHVIPEGESDVCEGLKVFPARVEHMPGKDSSKADAEVDVLT